MMSGWGAAKYGTRLRVSSSVSGDESFRAILISCMQNKLEESGLLDLLGLSAIYYRKEFSVNEYCRWIGKLHFSCKLLITGACCLFRGGLMAEQ